MIAFLLHSGYLFNRCGADNAEADGRPGGWILRPHSPPARRKRTRRSPKNHSIYTPRSSLLWMIASMKQSFAVAVGLLIVWKCASANWIVVAPFEAFDLRPPRHVYEPRYFVPKNSPIWRPPLPSDYDESAHSWSHPTFFYSGSMGGPTEEPYLRINWRLMAEQFTGILLLVSLGILVTKHVQRRKSEQAGMPNRR